MRTLTGCEGPDPAPGVGRAGVDAPAVLPGEPPPGHGEVPRTRTGYLGRLKHTAKMQHNL